VLPYFTQLKILCKGIELGFPRFTGQQVKRAADAISVFEPYSSSKHYRIAVSLCLTFTAQGANQIFSGGRGWRTAAG
jgi:hypothetical protein